MNSNALVGQVHQKRSATTVAAGPFQASAIVDQCKCLGQAVGVEPQLDAFLTGKEWVVAVHAGGLRCVGLQLRFELGVDKHGARMPALGDVGQQADLVLNQPICCSNVAPAQACHLTNPKA